MRAPSRCRSKPPDQVEPVHHFPGRNQHIKEFGTAADGRLFRASQGGHLLSKEYGEVWKAARLAVLTESEAASPLADVPYSLRHAGVSLWLESGVSPAEVARRAGHSIAVLFRFYAKAIHRNQQHANQQIERALKAEEEGGEAQRGG
ncbi:hypothetical protein [Streptomyces sp. NPDC004065]|uniref:hypothetical protein n=1 Tax=Streptomyces sp. NPDC004065 TaxID=3364689 RepID=UPI00384CCF94